MVEIKSLLKKLIIAVVIIFVLLIVIGAIGNYFFPIKKEIDKETTQYRIVNEEDLSFSNVIRWQVRATSTIINPTHDQVESIAKDIVKKVKEERAVNAISIFLYHDGDDIYGVYTIASIDYAPYGDWSRADEVNTGDYSKHTYHIEYA